MYGQSSSARDNDSAVDGCACLDGSRPQTCHSLSNPAGGRGLGAGVCAWPTVRLDPNIVFLVFLPPLLWAAAYFTSWRDFRANARPITLLAVGLVLATTAAVASVAHALLPSLGWAGAIVLGAIVSPPDAVSATAILKQLHLPRRGITILEGESLVNDATALVLYRAALATAVSGTFELGDTILDFVLAATVGIAVGFAVGIVCRWVLRMTEDSFSEIAITLLAPYIAWVLAEQAHASAVLACVVGGLYIRQHFSALGFMRHTAVKKHLYGNACVSTRPIIVIPSCFQ